MKNSKLWPMIQILSLSVALLVVAEPNPARANGNREKSVQ